MTQIRKTTNINRDGMTEIEWEKEYTMFRNRKKSQSEAGRAFCEYVAEVRRQRANGNAPPLLTALPSGPYAGIPLDAYPEWFLVTYLTYERVNNAVAEALLEQMLKRRCGVGAQTLPDALLNHPVATRQLIDTIEWEGNSTER